tara:strand:- start:442 stop:621 length:180 start_codon:yes stop_codon:yes gene_type:complete
MSKDVGMNLTIRATATVTKSVEKDLQTEDPTTEEAKAILEGEDEDTEGNDRERGNGDNQ